MTTTDDQALARYRYMLATAPPEDIERAHEEAFAKLTPDQRRQALEALAQVVPPGEIRGDDPASLARTATRAEIREPGTIERVWGPSGYAPRPWQLLPDHARRELHRDRNRAVVLRQRPGRGRRSRRELGRRRRRRQRRRGRQRRCTGSGGGDFGGGDFGGGDFGGGDFGGF